ncbi:MAG: hypothetical protein RSA79_01575 [Oscillospiraceae bacterium]
MNKISSREKTLLIALLVIIVAVFGFMFLIRPAMITRKENAIKIEELKTEKERIDADVSKGPKIKKDLEDATKAVIVGSENFYKDLPAWSAERLVTDLHKKHKIDYRSIAVSSPSPYVASTLPIYEKGETPPAQPAKPDENAVGATVITVEAGFNLASIAEVENLKAYLDEMSKTTKQASVASWTYKYDDSKKSYKGAVSVNFYCMDVSKIGDIEKLVNNVK